MGRGTRPYQTAWRSLLASLCSRTQRTPRIRCIGICVYPQERGVSQLVTNQGTSARRPQTEDGRRYAEKRPRKVWTTRVCCLFPVRAQSGPRRRRRTLNPRTSTSTGNAFFKSCLSRSVSYVVLLSPFYFVDVCGYDDVRSSYVHVHLVRVLYDEWAGRVRVTM